VKDVVSHLCTDELYNEACLDGNLDELKFSGGLDAWNESGVRQRRRMKAGEVLAEWERRQHRVRRDWGRIGLDGKIQTSIGPYPLRLQVWHLAREYAIHADDMEVPVPASQRRRRWFWRIVFGLYAAREEGEPVKARLKNGTVMLEHRGRSHQLDPETFIAYLTNRPQQLTDPGKRRLVIALGARG
jgi:hypothetical protein